MVRFAFLKLILKVVMMGKLFVVGMCCLGLCIPIMANGNQAHPLTKVADVRLPNLGYKTFFREFYANTMRGIFLSKYDESLDSEANDERLKLPYVGIIPNRKGQDRVAFFHPVKEYKMFDGDKRFLVMIEMANLDDDGSLELCHACASSVALFLFDE